MALTSAITVDTLPTTVSSRTLILTGTNHPDLSTIQVAGVPASVVQPTATTWRAELRLASGTNSIEISGLDIAAQQTETLTFDIELPELTQRAHQVRNVFDEFGTYLSLERLPGEKNLPYLNRLKDVGINPSDTTLRQLVFAMSRELGIQVRTALTLASPIDAATAQPRAVDGTAHVGPVYLDLASVRLRSEERIRVEPATQQIVLTKRPRTESDLIVTRIDGDPISHTLYSVDLDTLRVRFTTPVFNGSEVIAQFTYVERFRLTDHTIGSLKAAVEAVTGADGIALFTVTLKEGDTTPAADLLPTIALPIGRSPVDFASSPLRIRELFDLDFQRSQRNAQGHAIGTKLETWAKRINTQARIVWGATLLGESVWEPLGLTPRLGVLPHLSDASRGYWFCQDVSDPTRYTLRDYRSTGGVCPNDGTLLEYRGILPLEFQSGTGTQDDLKLLKIVPVRTEVKLDV